MEPYEGEKIGRVLKDRTIHGGMEFNSVGQLRRDGDRLPPGIAFLVVSFLAHDDGIKYDYTMIYIPSKSYLSAEAVVKVNIHEALLCTAVSFVWWLGHC